MTTISYGDLASSISSSRLISQAKQDLDQYTYEVASGEKSDVSSAVSGDFTTLSSLERSLRSVAAYETSQNEAALFTSGVQTVLGSVTEQISSVSLDLISASSSDYSANFSVAANEAHSKFESVVSALNTTISGRTAFGGTATGAQPLANAADILSEITTLVASETTATGVIAAVENWFNAPGGGFETNGYQGSPDYLSPFSLGENETATVNIKADDSAFRDVLKGLTLASLVDLGVLDGDLSQQSAILAAAGNSLLSSETELLTVQAGLGVVEEKIDDAQAARTVEEFALELARSDIASADPYEAASKLTQTETQLEIMYTITARLSRLKLSDYL